MKRKQQPKIHEIIYLKGVQNYTELFLSNGKKIISSYALLRHQEKLNGFLRVSKSHLLNPHFIAKINTVGSTKEVQMQSGKRVKVSGRRRNDIQFKLETYKIYLTR